MAVLNVVIYLPDNTGYQIAMPDGKNATTDKYFVAMAEALCIPEPLARKCFSLWLKSPLLGKHLQYLVLKINKKNLYCQFLCLPCYFFIDLQLKLQHVPFRMVKQWATFIEKFSMGSDEDKAKGNLILQYRCTVTVFCMYI